MDGLRKIMKNLRIRSVVAKVLDQPAQSTGILSNLSEYV
jgi:hypothetical protein